MQKPDKCTIIISNNTSQPLQLSFLNDKAAGSINASTLYQWDITGNPFTAGNVSVQAKPTGGSAFTTYSVPIQSHGADGLVAALNSLGFSFWYITQQGGTTFLNTMNDALVFSNVAFFDVTLPMQHFLQGATPSYPVGVFSVNKKFLGQAANSVAYATLWNSDADNQAIGTLSPAADPLHFVLAKKDATVQVPTAVYGLRYYQFDYARNVVDTVAVPYMGVIDFGDGSAPWLADGVTALPAGMNYYYNFSPSPVFKTGWTIGGGRNGRWYNDDVVAFALNNPVYTFNKTGLADSNPKTITVYHCDNDLFSFDDVNADYAAGGVSFNSTKHNLRGNLPIGTKCFDFSSTEQASYNTFSGITNISEWALNFSQIICRDGSAGAFNNWNFDLTPFKNLKSIELAVTGTYADTTPIKTLLGATDVTQKFPLLKEFMVPASIYTDDFVFCQNWREVAFAQPSVLTPARWDALLITLDQQKHDTFGAIIASGGATRSHASDAAVASLISKGVTVSGLSVQ